MKIMAERAVPATTEIVATDVTCNKCGKSMNVPRSDRLNVYGVQDITIGGGYDSPCLSDGSSYTFDLCEPCVTALMDTFVIPPKVESQDGDDTTYAEDKAQLAAWRASAAAGERFDQERVNLGFCTEEACASDGAERGTKCSEKASYRLVYPETHWRRDGTFQACNKHVFGLYRWWQAEIVPIGQKIGDRTGYDPPRMGAERLELMKNMLEAVELGLAAPIERLPRQFLPNQIPALLYLLGRQVKRADLFGRVEIDPTPAYRAALDRIVGVVMREAEGAGRLALPRRPEKRACSCPECERLDAAAEYKSWRGWAYQHGLANEILMGESRSPHGERSEDTDDAKVLTWWGEQSVGAPDGG